MSKTTPPQSVVIIGNGISGITLARHLRKKSAIPIRIISEETPYFFSRTALMYVFMGHMRFEDTQPYENDFWEKNNIQLIHKRITRVDTQKKLLLTQDATEISYDTLVIACGSKPNRFGWPGQDLKAVQGLYHKQDLEQLEKWSSSIKEATIVGGGLIGVELAEMLHSRGKKVHFLVREKSFWDHILPKEESEMINQHILAHGIDLQLNTELHSIEGDERDRAKTIVTKKGDRIPSQWVGLTVGVSPNIDFIKKSGLELGRGVKVNRYLETNLKDIYAIGDCAEQTQPLPQRRSIEAVWYTGRMMGETLAQTLLGNKTPYTPGHWFNSAKFFDIEYQTYGMVSAHPDAEEEAQFFWKPKKANVSLRFSYHPVSEKLLGVLALGTRIRHHVFDRWLEEERTLNYVLTHFSEAAFDPEFYPNFKPKRNAI